MIWKLLIDEYKIFWDQIQRQIIALLKYEVEQGVLGNGKSIAVKKLNDMHLDDAQFNNEVTYLIRLKHQNIVQLVGYCAESRWEATQVNGNYVMAEIRSRMLCFEYLNKKSLDKHLSGMALCFPIQPLHNCRIITAAIVCEILQQDNVKVVPEA